MTFVRLLFREDGPRVRRFFRIAAVSGISSTYAFYLVATASRNPADLLDSDGAFWTVLQFVVAVLVYCVSQHRGLVLGGLIIEERVHALRTRLLATLQAAELRDVETVGMARITGALVNDTQALSQAAAPIAFAGQALAMSAIAAVYLTLVSPLAMLLTAATTLVTGWVYLAHTRVVTEALLTARARASEMQQQVVALVSGFKELKLSRDKADEARATAVDASQGSIRHMLVAQRALSRDFVMSYLASLVLIGIVVFVMPWSGVTGGQSVSASLSAVIWLLSPLWVMLGAIPQTKLADVSIGTLLDLQRELESAVTVGRAETELSPATPLSQNFREIQLRGAAFRYAKQSGAFSVGPLHLSVRRGELLFVTGDNGAGKSTIFKILAGLYRPSAGTLLIDDEDVWPDRVGEYRALVSAVFSDFHLFDRLYGIRNLDPAWSREWLERLGIADKVSLQQGRFSTLALSTGQRKRLALFVALAERRPILLLDEWAADQDPSFRRRFYEELLPRLRAEGRTIVAITHDDAYFHIADRCVQVRAGMTPE
ncbi:MAG: hypothetical protein RIS35_985 [Pseudomonadota bacterium]